MRRPLLAFALACSLLGGAHGIAQSPASPAALATSLRGALAAAPPGATIGVSVIDATSGRVLFEDHPDDALNPASNTKILTAAAALSLLGPARTFATTAHGTLAAGVARGLVLRGEGDPSLRAADLDGLAAELAGAGVRAIEGDITLDDSRFGAEHLPPAFEQRPAEDAAYRAAVGALSVDENAITLSVRGEADGAPCAIWATPASAASVAGQAVTARVPSLALQLAPEDDGRTRVTVRGQCAAGVASFRRRALDPTRGAGLVFRDALRRHGIAFAGALLVGAVPSPGPALATRSSLPLSALLYEVGKDSNNFTAEMTLLAIGAEGRATTTFAEAAARVTDWARARGVGVSGLVLRNGSGLYDANRFSARQTTQVLRAAWRDPAIRDEFVAQLAAGGSDGTLRGRLAIPGAPRVVRAKTGTLDDAVALSGYVLTRDPSRTVAFSVLANGVRGRADAARRVADAVVTAIAGFTRGR